MLSLHDPVTRLHLVSPANEKALNRLAIKTIKDLLFYFPRDWQDLSEIKNISEIRPGEKVTIRAKIKKLSQYRTPRRHMNLTQSLLEDQTGNILAVWFNQPFLKNVLQQGREYYFHGKAQVYENLQLQNPTFELVKEKTIHTAGIVPSYELTQDLTQKQLRYWLKLSLAGLPQVKEHLPENLKSKLGLVDHKTAIEQIHFPKNQEQLLAAKKRLSFDELFLFQLALQGYKQKLKILPAPLISFNTPLVKKFVTGLPFKLTNSQRRATWEILKDLAHPFPMNRLLEGEVGSGKTVVAGIAMLEVANAGWQGVLLAPTEILAWQHYQTLKELFKNTKLNIALLTRSHKETTKAVIATPTQSRGKQSQNQDEIAAPPPAARNDILLNNIASGQIKIIIGTHALLQEKVAFQRIGLLVVDEQHRFGVHQRAQLQTANQQGLVPHFLSMTATPIPRTLALTFYGDLNISQLRELPRGRKKVITRLVAPEKREVAYEFVRKEINKGRRAYVITPLIEESSTSPLIPPQAWGGVGGEVEPLKRNRDIKSVKTESEKLKKIFPQFQIGLLHGRLKGEEKKNIMADFQSGKIQILVSTTVVEVGVDVPQATVMWIENAEHFGLAQLHQLRGRVGRSDLQSYCLLFAESLSEATLERLNAVVKSTDGFELAEKDLELRGPGEIMGTQQSGYIPFKIAKLSDRRLIKTAKEEAEKLLDFEPTLASYPLLKQKIQILARDAHLE